MTPALRMLLVVALLAAGVPAVGQTSLKVWYRNYNSPPVRALLELALAKTPEYGETRIEASEPMSQGRVLHELEKGRTRVVRLANVATSREREEKLLAVPFPIDSGLLGLRVCLIRQGEAGRFADIHRPSQFIAKGLIIGQGSHWPDAEILRANGYAVRTSARFEQLFDMLREERFDCFLRGVGEVFVDLAHEDARGLAIEPHLLFSYRMPNLFFLSPEDTELAERLESGLKRAVADGSYEAFFESHFGRALDRLDLPSRQVFRLFNPLLTERARAIPNPLKINGARFPEPE